MSTYTQVKTALAAALDASTTLAAVYANPPDNAITPSAIILPGNSPVDYAQTLQNGLTRITFTVLVIVQRFETLSNLTALDDYILSNSSIYKLLDADTTLGGVVATAAVTRCSNIGLTNAGEDTYLGAEFEIEIYL